ncbi:MAG: hypothetical protein HOE90_18515 [Bacteriovoracaceae bacterium]|jgi:hypothetical protein|nr:hypothetical protein [Bacteriovoracaceae bacterium]
MINYQYLVDHQEIVVSKSHTHNKDTLLALAASVAAKKDEYSSIGVDVEFEGRKIDPATHRFFIGSKELALGFSPLEIWCIKEACYKSLWPLFHEKNPKTKIVLSNIVIEKDKFSCLKDQISFEGEFSVERRNCEAYREIVAIAWINS